MNQYAQGCRCEECHDERTAVVFRVWNQWAGSRSAYVLALFPEIDAGGGMCSSYEHVGQHGGADYLGCIARTTPSTPAEYADLKAELEGLGYNLRIVRRRPPIS